MTPEERDLVIGRIVLPAIQFGGERYRRYLTAPTTMTSKVKKLRRRSNKLTLQSAVKQSIDGSRNNAMGKTLRDVAVSLTQCHTGVVARQPPVRKEDPHQQLVIRAADGTTQVVRLDVGSQAGSKNGNDQRRQSESDLAVTGAIALQVFFAQDEHSTAPRDGIHYMTGPEFLTWLGIGGHEIHQEIMHLANREFRTCQEYEQDLEARLVALLQRPRGSLPAITIPQILVPLACPNATIPERVDVFALMDEVDNV